MMVVRVFQTSRHMHPNRSIILDDCKWKVNLIQNIELLDVCRDSALRPRQDLRLKNGEQIVVICD